MWVSESFASLAQLVFFLNDRKLRCERCKLLVSRDAEGAQLFHVVFKTGADDDLATVATAAAESEPLDGEDAEDAVDAAQAILLEASREE